MSETTLQSITPAELSRLLFRAREECSMWADIVEIRTGRAATSTRLVVAEIDALRAAQGWNPGGFGGEG